MLGFPKILIEDFENITQVKTAIQKHFPLGLFSSRSNIMIINQHDLEKFI